MSTHLVNSGYNCFTFFLFTLLFLPSSLIGQHFALSNGIRFEQLSSDDGLPANSANAFLHDSQGYIWIGTFNGLARYDGQNFQIFQKKEGLKGDYVMALYEDSRGDIWIGTMFDGLIRFSPKTEKFINYPLGGDKGISWRYVTEILEDANGTIWVGTTGGLNALTSTDGTFDPTTIEVQHFFPFYYPDTLLKAVRQRLVTNNTLARLTEVGNGQSRTMTFQLNTNTTVLISAMGEYGGQGRMLDYGWISNEKNERIWTMDYTKSHVAQSVEPKEDHSMNRQVIDLLDLPAGKYTIHYKSNQQHSYNNWSLPKNPVPYDNDEAVVPRFSELWGIVVLACDTKEKKQYQQWLEEAAQSPVISGNIITSMAVVNNHKLLVGTNGGLDQIDILQQDHYNITALHHSDGQRAACSMDFVNHIFVKNEKDIKIYGGQLNYERRRYDLNIQQTDTALFHYTNYFQSEEEVHHGQLFEDRSGKLWLTNYGKGLYRLDEDRSAPFGFILNDFPLDNSNFWKAYKDRSGVIWLGVWKAGVYLLHPTVGQFYFQQLPVKENTFVTGLAKTKEGAIYISTNKEGLFRWNPVTKELQDFRNFSKGQSLPTMQIQCIVTDDSGKLWIGFQRNGLASFDPESGQWQHFIKEEGKSNSLPHDDVHSLLTDHQNQIWAGTLDGLSKYNPETNDFSNYINPKVDVSYDHLLDIYEDRERKYWLINGVRGLFVLDAKLLLQNEPNAFHEIQQSEQVWKVFEDSAGRFWMGDRKGLAQIDKATGQVIEQVISQADINFIQEDKNGMLWLSSNKGIFRYDPETNTSIRFDDKNGIYLKGEQFGSGLQLADGAILVGGRRGFYYFDPETIAPNHTAPQLAIKAITFPDFMVAEDSTLADIDLNKPLYLDYQQNTMTIHFQGLHYDVGQPKEYAYRLLDSDKDWISIGEEQYVRLSRLLPGDHIFEVRVKNGEHTETKSVVIHISPPWWKTNITRFVFLLLVVGIVYWVYRFQLKQALQREETKRAEELNRMKSNFFANITHELRTPLTLIIEPVRQLLQKVRKPEDRSLLIIIRNNSMKLLEMVNQLLDLAKLDENQMKLEIQKSRMQDFLNNRFADFEVLADKKNIDLQFHLDEQLEPFYFDMEKVERVLFNLLSNALKFAPENGHVSLHMQRVDQRQAESNTEFVRLSVRDNGPGISADVLPKIFDRFFQGSQNGQYASSGSGIGLALSKELAELMKGQLTVESEPDKGTSFHLLIPLLEKWNSPVKDNVQPAVTGLESAGLESGHPNELESQNKKPYTVLLVEDNEELRQFLKNYLAPKFNILEAAQGEEGVDVALAEIPDLIISDWMMPVKSGIQLCEELKRHELTAHIPIILLTAKSHLDSRIEGLSTGADVYLTKPFHSEELATYVHQLIANRVKLRKAFAQNRSMTNLKTNLEKQVKEDPFLIRLNALILEHISDSAFNVEVMAVKMHLSQSQLFRKVKAVTDQSPNKYLRNFRLEHAVELLQQKRGNVSEVAQMVGFNDEKYFSTCFKKRFAYSPSELLS